MSANLEKSTKKYTLNTGAQIPAIGLGTWESYENTAYEATLTALRLGYRHIDTAAYYRNERQVGRAIKDSGIPREDIFLTSKLWSTQHDDPATALDDTLERLGLDYVDLYLVHWPVAIPNGGRLVTEEELFVAELPDWVATDGGDKHHVDPEGFVKVWEKFQELPKSKARAIGVSNFSIANIESLKKSSGFKTLPAVNQVELHPLLPQNELIEYGRKEGIIIEAYSPLGQSNSPYFTNKTLREIADSYGVSVVQLLINWGLKRGYVVLPKSSNPERIESNLKEFDLKDEDVKRVSSLIDEFGENRLVYPKFTGDFPLFR